MKETIEGREESLLWVVNRIILNISYLDTLVNNISRASNNRNCSLMFHQTALDRTVTPVYLDLIFILSKEPHNLHRNSSSAASQYSLWFPAWKVQEKEIEKKLLLGKHLYLTYINLPSQSAYPVWLLPSTLTNSFS